MADGSSNNNHDAGRRRVSLVLEYDILTVSLGGGVASADESIAWNAGLDAEARRAAVRYMLHGTQGIIIHNASCADKRRGFVARLAVNRIENYLGSEASIVETSASLDAVIRRMKGNPGMNADQTAEVKARLGEMLDMFARLVDDVCHAYESRTRLGFKTFMAVLAFERMRRELKLRRHARKMMRRALKDMC